MSLYTEKLHLPNGFGCETKEYFKVFIFDEIFDGCHKREVFETPAGRPG